MKNLRAAVLGVGYLGSFHAQKYTLLPGVELVAVVDIDNQRAQTIADQFGVAAYTSHKDILDQVDLVSIAVPTQCHFSIAKDCLEAGIHVLIEKPITNTLAEAQELIDLANAKGLVFQVGQLERFNPALQLIEAKVTHPQFIEAYRLAPFKARGTDVDVVLDLMIHDIDLVLSMVSSPLANIRPFGVSVLTDHIDIANARLEFANGCIANITASRVNFKTLRQFRIFQPHSYISIDSYARKVAIHKKHETNSDANNPLIGIEEHRFEEADILLEEIRSFVHSVHTQTAPVVSGEDGKRALEVALEITSCIKTSTDKNFQYLLENHAAM